MFKIKVEMEEKSGINIMAQESQVCSATSDSTGVQAINYNHPQVSGKKLCYISFLVNRQLCVLSFEH